LVFLELGRFILLSRKGAELAIPYIECALRIARSRYRKARQKELYIYYDTLGLALNMIGDLKRALRMTEKAFRISVRNNGFRHRDTALQFEKRARIFKKAGVKAEEIYNLEMALYIYSSLYGDDSFSAQNAQKALDEAKSSSGQ
jgi:tetratricopeptide (TPR) repeat protein